MSQAFSTVGLVGDLAAGVGEVSRVATWVAHGVGTRKDLPIPFGAALGAAVVALVASFVALGALWKKPRLTGAAAGRPVSPGVARALDAPWFRWTLRGVGLVLTAYFLLALLVGLDDALNPAPGVVYVLFWVGTLVVASALLGPVWRMLNPVRTVHLVGCRVMVHDPRKGFFRLPAWVGHWPAALALLTFGWLELVAPNRATLPSSASTSSVMSCGSSSAPCSSAPAGSTRPTASRSCPPCTDGCRSSAAVATESWSPAPPSTASPGSPHARGRRGSSASRSPPPPRTGSRRPPGSRTGCRPRPSRRGWSHPGSNLGDAESRRTPSCRAARRVALVRVEP